MSNNHSTEGIPVQIAYLDEHKLVIDIERCETILSKAGDHPLSVISVNGPMRSGKSYILGYFLRYLSVHANHNVDWINMKFKNEFRWLNSAERQTTGVYMWSEPFFIERDGRTVAVLLMDNQGFFDDESTTLENSLIFALSCLLSSVLIYNVPKQLSEDIFQFLQMFIGFARMSEGSEQSQTFTKLIFLIRDWQFYKEFGFGYHDDTNSPGPKNFKKEKVDVKDSMMDEARIVRQDILSSFINIGCCLMPYPGDDLAQDDKVENLSSRFVETVKDFIPRIFNANIVIKKIGGQEISGHNMKKFIKEWANEFAKIELPEVKNLTESTATVQNQIAVTLALKLYCEKMDKIKDKVGLSDEEFEKVHKENMEEAFALFKRMKRLKNENIKIRYFEDLKKYIHREHERYEEINCSARRFLKMKIEAEEREKRFLIETKEYAKRAREYEEQLRKEIDEIAKKSQESEEKLRKVMEENTRKVQEDQEALEQKIKEIVKNSQENKEHLRMEIENSFKESQEARKAANLEMKIKEEDEKQKKKIELLNMIKQRSSQMMNELKKCISNYLEEIKTIIKKTEAFKSYVEGIIPSDASGFAWLFTKTLLTAGIAIAVHTRDIHSKSDDLVKDIELFEINQKYCENEFSARVNEVFLLNEQIARLNNFCGDDTSNNLNISLDRNIKLITLDTSSYIHSFRNYSPPGAVLPIIKKFVTALYAEKRHCKSILMQIK